jgi:hypothetical protein
VFGVIRHEILMLRNGRVKSDSSSTVNCMAG